MDVKLGSLSTRLWDIKCHLTFSALSFLYKAHSALFRFCRYKRDAVVSIVTRLRAEHPRYRGSLLCRYTGSARTHWLWGPPSLLSGDCQE